MRRRDVAASIAIGLGLLAFILLFGWGSAHPVGNAIERTLTLGWPIGVVATIAAAMGRRRWWLPPRLLGYVGVSWLAFDVSYGLLWLVLAVLIAVNGGIGY